MLAIEPNVAVPPDADRVPARSRVRLALAVLLVVTGLGVIYWLSARSGSDPIDTAGRRYNQATADVNRQYAAAVASLSDDRQRIRDASQALQATGWSLLSAPLGAALALVGPWNQGFCQSDVSTMQAAGDAAGAARAQQSCDQQAASAQAAVTEAKSQQAAYSAYSFTIGTMQSDTTRLTPLFQTAALAVIGARVPAQFRLDEEAVTAALTTMANDAAAIGSTPITQLSGLLSRYDADMRSAVTAVTALRSDLRLPPASLLL